MYPQEIGGRLALLRNFGQRKIILWSEIPSFTFSTRHKL